MTWLLFSFALELGAIRGSDIPVDVSSYVQTETTVTLFKHLEIGGKLRSYQVPDDSAADWAPFRMDYSASAVVRFGVLSFGVESLCYHPVVPYRVYRFTPVDGWTDRAFVRIATPR